MSKQTKLKMFNWSAPNEVEPSPHLTSPQFFNILIKMLCFSSQPLSLSSYNDKVINTEGIRDFMENLSQKFTWGMG